MAADEQPDAVAAQPDLSGELARYEAELAQARQRLALISLVTNILISREPLRKQLAELAQLGRIMLDCDVCVIRQLEIDCLAIVAVAGMDEKDIPESLPVSPPGMLAPALKYRKPVVIEDTSKLGAEVGSEHDFPDRRWFVSYAGVPMVTEETVIGTFSVICRTEARAFSENDLELLKILANHSAVAIENDRTAREAQLDREKRLRAELALTQTEQIYRDAIWAQGGVPYRRRFNESAYDFIGAEIFELTGFRADELTQEFFSSRIREIHPLVPEARMDREERRTLTRAGKFQRWRADYLFERKDETLVWIVDASIPWVEDGVVVGSLGILRDVSQRKRTEEALRERETRLQMILDAVPECVAIISPEGVVVDVNAGGRAIFGADSSARIKGQFLADFISAEYRDEYRTFFRSACGGPTQPYNLEIVTYSGATKLVEAQAVPLRDMKGALTAVLCVARDVSERHELEVQLRQSQRMEAVGHLAGGVAHDFNNILTGILGLIELAMSSTEDQMLVSDLREIRRLGERGADLTRQLLAFSRHTVSKPVVFSLNGIVDDTRKLLRTLLGENVELVTQLDPDLACIKADPSQLEQVIVNLAVNARDAMPNGGRLTITTRQVNLREDTLRRRLSGHSDTYAMLAVTDTGQGMSEDVRERIFEPFFTTKQPGRGTGLGLATVYGIIKQSDGDIWVFSQPGQGTTFQIYLPCIEEEVLMMDEEPESVENLLGTETVLVVEDEQSVRSLITRVLHNRGYQALEASNGAEALDLFQMHMESIPLIVTDIIMPMMGGTELAKRVRELKPDLKILFISGYTSDDFSVDENLDPLTRFIQKPFSPATLGYKVRELLDLQIE